MSAPTSLTRTDAEARAALLTVDGYDVELDLTTGEDTFRSRSTVRFTCQRPGAGTVLDVAPETLLSVTLNGVPLDAEALQDRRFPLEGLADHNEVVVDAVMRYSHDGDGLHRHVDPADGRAYVYAMSFLDAAPRWFACVDQPDLKAPVSLAVRCPDDWTVAGNGAARRDDDGVWRLRSTGPLATYFTTLLAGPYHQVRSEHDGISLVLHARAAMADVLEAQAAELFEHTAACLDRLHALFGSRYPWGEYHQAFVPDFNAGAMENPGCVTISESLLFRGRTTEAERVERRVTVAHEMAHMWFGDLVTMRWWDDLWLNESFAEYLGQRVTGDAAWTQFGAVRKSWGYTADRRPSTHPVAGNGAPDAASALNDFDGISYAKGASVLRQLAAHLGDDTFLAGLRLHIERHAHGNASFADLAESWADAGAEGLDGWLAAWLRTTGLDELAALDGAVERRGTEPDRVHAVTAQAYAPDGTELMRRPLSLSAGSTPCPVPDTAAVVLPDAFDETWAKTVLPAAAWRAMPELLPRLADSRTRVSVWNALQLATADAELDPTLALDVVVAALPGEIDAVLAPVGRWAVRTLTGSYLPAGSADRLHDAFAAALGRAAGGSDEQLALMRQVIATAPDPAPLQRWADGRDLPDGLTLDPELRWGVLLRLARLGAVDAARIDAEAAADTTTQGLVHAARCRAARPDAAAKEAAWTAITTDAARSNGELYALAEGFWSPGQRELTAPWVERYAEQIAATATLRSGAVVGRLALLAFPWTATDRASLDMLHAVLDREDLSPTIRRSVTDAADDLRRAVEVRERFG